MRAMKKVTAILGALALACRVLVLVAQLTTLYLRLYFTLKVWKATSRLRFRARVRGLPKSLVDDLIREYDGAVSRLGLPSPLEARHLASRRFRRREGKGGGMG